MEDNLFYDSKGGAHELPVEVEPDWRISAYVVVEREGSILMIKSRFSGLWELPGGGVDLGEVVSEGAIREAREETGYDTRILGQAPFFLKQTRYHAYYFGKGFHHGVMCFYHAELVSETQQALSSTEAKEVESVQWRELSSITSEELTPAIREVIEHLQIPSGSSS